MDLLCHAICEYMVGHANVLYYHRETEESLYMYVL